MLHRDVAVAWSVCLSVFVFGVWVSYAKTAEPISTLPPADSCEPRNHILDGDPDLKWEWALLRMCTSPL